MSHMRRDFLTDAGMHAVCSSHRHATTIASTHYPARVSQTTTVTMGMPIG